MEPMAMPCTHDVSAAQDEQVSRQPLFMHRQAKQHHKAMSYPAASSRTLVGQYVLCAL